MKTFFMTTRKLKGKKSHNDQEYILQTVRSRRNTLAGSVREVIAKIDNTGFSPAFDPEATFEREILQQVYEWLLQPRMRRPEKPTLDWAEDVLELHK